jgi:hypothetical protein
MSKTSTYADQFGFAGDGFPNAQPWTSGPIVNTPSPASQEPWNLTVTTNSLPVPAGTLWMKVIPTSAGGAKTWKGAVSGDTGTRIHPTNASTFWFDPAAVPATVYLTATIVETVFVVFG